MSRQRVVKFGTATPLSGVLTEPVGGGARQPVAAVILNSGILHHVGANRLHVQLARRLADLGFTSLRFDFSGMGDSEARRDDLSFEQSAPRETIDAIDYLVRSQGATSVVLIGLCSGADVAHLTAVSDTRVVGLGMLDPWAYRTPMYHVHYYAHRLVRPAVYANWLKIRWGRLGAAVRRAAASGGQDPDMYEVPSYLREFPPRESVARDLTAFMARKIQLFCLFSGGLQEYNHLGQYRESFPEVDFAQRLREAHLPTATHVFSGLEHQAFVVGELSDWVKTRFATSAGTATAARTA